MAEEKINDEEVLNDLLGTTKKPTTKKKPDVEPEDDVTEEKDNTDSLATFIKSIKTHAVYKDNKILGDKYVVEGLDERAYSSLATTLKSLKKEIDYSRLSDKVQKQLAGYLYPDQNLFKELPEAYKDGNFKDRFPNPDKEQFISYMVTVITTLTEQNYHLFHPLKIMAHFGISKQTLITWIEDKDLKSKAEDTHTVLTAQGIGDIYQLKFDAIIATVSMPKNIENQKLPSLATDTSLGINKLSQDMTYYAKSGLDFDSIAIQAKDTMDKTGEVLEGSKDDTREEEE